MIVLHMDSGLGNQMLDYAEYLAVKKANPGKDIYIETFYYDLPDGEPGMFAHWNGYELESIFGIKAPLLKDIMSKDAWERASKKVRDSHFWQSGWNYADVTVEALKDEGICLTNMQKNSTASVISSESRKQKPLRKIITAFFRTYPGLQVKRIMRYKMRDKLIQEENAKFDVYKKYDDDTYAGHSLSFRFKGFGIEKVDSEIRKAFAFRPLEDPDNLKALGEIRSTESVAVHVRRGDLLKLNSYCYRNGYFKRSVRYIKEHTKKPVFFFFTDPGSLEWCKENAKLFGLDFEKDDVRFITWNSGKDSFKDMQLMSECRHNIITESTFGLWGAYLNNNPDKITCSPDPVFNTTVSF